MNVALTLPFNQNEIFSLKNGNRCLRGIDPRPQEDFITTSEDLFSKTMLEVESSLIPISQIKVDGYNSLLNLRASYIVKRNEIFDNFFKYINPKYQRKLREIDAKIDELDLQLYSFESKWSIQASALNEMILSAEAKLRKYTP